MESKELTILPSAVVAAFTGEKLDEILKRIKEDALNHVADTTTASGRKQVASKAYSIAQKKTQIDEVGKNLVAEWKAKAAKVDAARKKARDYLDDLKVRVREPLTNWEIAEEARIKAELLRKEIEAAQEAALVENDLFDRTREIERKEREFAAEAERKAELERLRIEEENRIAHEKKISDEAAERAKKEAQEAIEKAAREADEKVQAEIRARILSEEKAKEDAIRAKLAAEAEAKRIADKAKADQEAAVEAERKRAAAIEADRVAKAKAETEAAEKKARNEAHRKRIRNDAYTCFVSAGFEKSEAVKIIETIDSGTIKNITINY